MANKTIETNSSVEDYLAAIAPGWLSARIGTAGELMLLAVLCFALIVSSALVDKLFNRSSIGA